MKKCLLISYYFPPREGIGSQRPSKIAKYFPEFGWETVILTARLPGTPQGGVRIIETDYRDILASGKSLFGFDPEKSLREQLNLTTSGDVPTMSWKGKTIKLARELLAFPDEQKGWYKYAMTSARELLNRETFDVILSTSSPVTSHIIARQLKKEYQIPWIADLRDLWSQNHFNDKFTFIRQLERRLELKTLDSADALVTVTSPFAGKLAALHPAKRISCITNGFDSDDFSRSPRKLTAKFTLTYTGIFYNGKRDPSLLLETIATLIREKQIDGNLTELRLYGPTEKWLLNTIHKYQLDGVAHLYGSVSRKEALKRQRESQVLVLLLDKNDREKDVYPAKIFEYLGAGRPIIALGGEGGVVRDLLNATGSGTFVDNKGLLETNLLNYYREYVSSGEVACNSNDVIGKYSYREIARRYSDLLNGTAGK